jgi:hypothetical protein
MSRLVVHARPMIIAHPYHMLCAIKLVSALHTISSPHQTRQHAWQVSIAFSNTLNGNEMIK